MSLGANKGQTRNFLINFMPFDCRGGSLRAPGRESDEQPEQYNLVQSVRSIGSVGPISRISPIKAMKPAENPMQHKLITQNPEPKTQNSELRTQNS